eukprot:gene19357-27419_t
MKKAVIYARYSTDLQNERSVSDQFDVCRAYANREGFQVVGTYEDRAISGASIIGRPGLLALLSKANSGGFDALIVEAIDRLS